MIEVEHPGAELVADPERPIACLEDRLRVDVGAGEQPVGADERVRKPAVGVAELHESLDGRASVPPPAGSRSVRTR